MLPNVSETLHSQRKLKNKQVTYNLKSLTQKTKIWQNNVLSGRFGKYSFQLCIGKLNGSQMVPTLKSHSLSLNLTPLFLITLKIMPEVHEKRPGKSGTVHSITMHVSYIIFIHFALYLE